MLRFLDFPSSAIQISTLSALPSLLEKAATSQKVSLPSQETYSALVFRVFDSFSEPNLYVSDCPTMSRMSVAREGAWKAIAALAPTILVSGKEISLGIMLRLTGLDRQSSLRKEATSLSQLRDSCRVAAQFFANFAVEPLLFASIMVLLSSRWFIFAK
ncbi:hypothetical protein MHU86_11515 [Fragilaria crotonensis]|nr:hypothetical protein MHU86_11515 [Fragilaria crotonensis]